MGLAARFMNAVQAGWQAFNERALVPEERFGWEEFPARQFRYAHNAAYYSNIIYSSLSTYATAHKARYGLYRHIRGVYNPVARQNDLLVAYVYGGGLDLERMMGGAIPILSDNTPLIDALRQVFIWSQMGQLKSLYVRWGAQYGDVAWKIVDDREKQKVRLELLHPGKIRAADFDNVGNVKAVTIEYQREDPPPAIQRPGLLGLLDQKQPTPYTYTEQIDKDSFRTFKDGEPFAFYNDANGNPVSEWANDYGFIPVVIANHKETGLHWGECSFHNSRRKIDEVNDFASLLNDQVRKSVNALWYFAGVRQQAELVATAATDKRDETPAIYGPEGSQPYAMVANLPIDQALATLEKMLSELEDDMPELALQRIRNNPRSLTAPGVRSGYSDAIGRIQEARGNYDQALIRALQMAVTMGGMNGYENFSGFGIDSYARGDLDFTIKERPVIDDSLAKGEKLTALGTVGNSPPPVQRLILKELDYSDDEIEEVVTAAEAQQEQQTRAAVRGLSDSLFGNQNGNNANDNANTTAQANGQSSPSTAPQLAAVAGS